MFEDLDVFGWQFDDVCLAFFEFAIQGGTKVPRIMDKEAFVQVERLRGVLADDDFDYGVVNVATRP